MRWHYLRQRQPSNGTAFGVARVNHLWSMEAGETLCGLDGDAAERVVRFLGGRRRVIRIC